MTPQEMHCDLMRQGFMKKPKKYRNNISPDEQIKILTIETRQKIEYDGDRYKLLHPQGHYNYLTLSDLKKVARLQFQTYGAQI